MRRDRLGDSMKELLLTLLEEFKAQLDELGQLVVREAAFPDVRNKIKVAIGMRRSGKTFFVYEHIQNLLQQKIPLSRILYINFEDDRLLPMNQKQLATLLESFYSLYPENHRQLCYLFLDEIQNVDNWALVVRRFFDSKKVDMYLLGSSAKLLSKEISTSLRGRSLSTEIWPYSFNEFMSAKNISISKKHMGQNTLDELKKIFIAYLEQGGFPEVLDYPQAIRQQTLQEYVSVTTLRDIVERHDVKNINLIKYLIKRLIHDAASSFSINKIYNDLKSQGYAVGKGTLYNYLDYIEDAYLSFSVSLYSESLRKTQTNLRKTYAIDTGLVKAYSLSFKDELGRMFENVIYLDLRRMGCKVYYYLTRERYEVDFIAISPMGQRMIIQVVWDTEDDKTYERERRALDAAKKELKIAGKIITLDTYLREGIHFSVA